MSLISITVEMNMCVLRKVARPRAVALICSEAYSYSPICLRWDYPRSTAPFLVQLVASQGLRHHLKDMISALALEMNPLFKINLIIDFLCLLKTTTEY